MERTMRDRWLQCSLFDEQNDAKNGKTNIRIAHLFFEQSGVFKNEFKRLGIRAYDYDILNDFGETDYQIDLFSEIEKAYGGGCSLFDKIEKNDLIFAFFPCTRFEEQIQMAFRGTQFQMKNYSITKKLECDLTLHKELSELYELVTKLAIVCLKKCVPLIIENPYSSTHYLTKYWAIPSTLIDTDRRKWGDDYKKPTQYWFINCEPKNNLICESYPPERTKTIVDERNKVERSLINKNYARRFIKEFIL